MFISLNIFIISRRLSASFVMAPFPFDLNLIFFRYIRALLPLELLP
ncbi:hypothetical protein SynA1840_00446 [Synechococcus sp. A18-40]|nr:hypothetical protein SynA1840_00446 [Synechococcus sp. A18-40]